MHQDGMSGACTQEILTRFKSLIMMSNSVLGTAVVPSGASCKFHAEMSCIYFQTVMVIKVEQMCLSCLLKLNY